MLFAPFGPVTGETWLKYLNFLLPRGVKAEHAVVLVDDWYGPHLSGEADAFVLDRTLSPQLIQGGGTTGKTAV